jgi:hypothetical protein
MLLHRIVDVVTGPLNVAAHSVNGAAASCDAPKQQCSREKAKYDSVIRFHRFLDCWISGDQDNRGKIISPQQHGSHGWLPLRIPA